MIGIEEKYEILQTLYRSPSSIIFRAMNIQTQEKVIIKTLNRQLYNHDNLNKLKNEYQILIRLGGDYVIKAHDFVNIETRFAIIIEDFGAVSLAQYIQGRRLDLRVFLDIALKICTCLDYIHQHQIIHKDINPSNIVFNPESEQIKIIDFGISSEYCYETMPAFNPHVIESTLQYMSPEQTGRMNRPIDYRADFYLLGVTLYELACGQLPFVTSNPAEMVYSHIALEPIPVHKIDPAVPESISCIISKLMAKVPEDRYQSTAGIIFDLRKCMESLDMGSDFVAKFKVGTGDLIDKFEIPKKLYGRESELDNLLSSFERIRQGKAELVLISGYSGIGKTSLVRELHKPIIREQGIFISGKYDQYTKNKPFSALIKALDQFCSYILSEPEPSIELWRSRILEALTGRGRLITELIPRLELVIGEQPVIQEVSPTEEQFWFKIALKKLILTISFSEHPVVFFMDDIHWADMASLELFKSILTDSDVENLMFIGAYRSNEVNASHPLIRSIEKMKKDKGTVKNIHLQNLSLMNITDLICDFTKSSETEAVRLAKIVIEKTMGNPFYTIEFFNLCYTNGLIYYNPNANAWEWDEANIRSIKLSDNVIDYLIEKIGALPKDTRDLISVAACIGDNFSLRELAMIYGKEDFTVSMQLKPAVAAEMIYSANDDRNKEIQFQFCHDKFQQAGYQLLSVERRQYVHLDIARYYDNLVELEGSARLFMVAEHYSKALNCLHSEEEIHNTIDIFFRTARAAISSSAFDTARKYLDFIEAMASQEMKSDKSFMLHLYSEQHLALFSLALFDELDVVFSRIGLITNDPLELVDVYCIQLISLSNRSRYEEAFFLGVSLLEKLDVHYPHNQLVEKIEEAMEEYYSYEQVTGFDGLEEMPVINDAKTQSIAKLLNRMQPAGLFFNPLSAFWAICTNTNFMIKNGMTPWSLESSAAFILPSIALRNDYRTGYKLAKSALAVCYKHGFISELYRIYHILGLFTGHWFQPLENGVYYAHEAFKGNLDNGEFEFSCYSYFSSQVAVLEICSSISEMQMEVEAAYSFAHRTNNLFALSSFITFKQLIKAIKGEASSHGSFNDIFFQEEKYLIEIKDHAIAQCYYSIYRALSAIIFGDYKKALTLTNEIAPLLPHMSGFYTIALHNFLHSLAICRTISELAEGKERENLRIKLRNNQVWMKKRAQDAPFNFQHLYALINAEILVLEGRYDNALRLYETAITTAQKNKRPYHYALFCELAGQRYLHMGIMKIAAFYLKEAYSAYLAWEATGKTSAMKKEYPQLLFSNIDMNSVQYYSPSTIFSDSIDLGAVIQATQAISGEIERKKLLKTLMTIILENSGSNRGYFLLKDLNRWILSRYESIAGVLEPSFEEKEFVLENHDAQFDLPAAIINYVIRTKEPLIIGNVEESQFASNNYFKGLNTLSALCFPVLFQNSLKGIVYLENDLLTDAFSNKRLEVLNILGSQAAISLENSALFADLDKKVALRTFQLEQEIADHKKTEQALSQSEERFHKAFHSSPIMMAILSTKDYSFIEVNQSFLDELECDPDEVISSTPDYINMWADYQPNLLIINQIKNDIKIENAECKLLSRTGKPIFALISTECLTLNNQDCLLMVMQNISEKKEYEANLYRMDRLNLIGEMAAGIGHEIRNPMTAIRGFLQLLSGNDYYEKDHMYFELMIEELDRANGIISEYLGMAKDKRVNLQPNHLDHIVDSIFPMISADANYQGMAVELILNSPPMLLIDEKEIRQMILNMARNGLEAMSPGGILTIGTRVENDDVILYIKDEGDGLSPDLLDKLGTPFVTTKEKGTGLGLAVCYSIAARHHAEIKVQTSPQGTTFTVFFPLPKEADQILQYQVCRAPTTINLKHDHPGS